MTRSVVVSEEALSLDVAGIRRVLDATRDLGKTRKIRDQAVAMKMYLRQQGDSIQAQLDASELHLWATRRVGELLAATDFHEGGRPSKTSNTMLPVSLSDLGITKMQSSRWQQVASVPLSRFEDYIASERARSQAPTVAGALRHHRKIETERTRQDMMDAIGDDEQDDAGTVSVCSIEELCIEPKSVDMVFTDPPYHDEYLSTFDRLGEVAAHALKPGGFCLVYTGKMYLPQVLESLGAHLDYFWMFVVYHPFSKRRINSLAIFENYRPIVVFRKSGGKTQGPNWVQDALQGTRGQVSGLTSEQKVYHEWQQDEDAPRKYIEAYTEPGNLVLDPFSGGGTTASVCKATGRRFLCFDKDVSAVKLSLARLRGVSSQPSSNNLEGEAS